MPAIGGRQASGGQDGRVQAAAGVVPATAPATILGVWPVTPKDNEAEFAS